jgi:hypothetical protein
MRPYLLSILALTLAVPAPARAASVFTTRIDDPAAVYLTAQDFGVKGDGRTDDTAAVRGANARGEGSGHASASARAGSR